MHRIVIAVLLFVGVFPTAQQTNPQPTTVLVFRTAQNEPWRFRFDENQFFDHDKLLRDPKTKVAVRLCSPDPLKRALITSRQRVDTVINFLKQVYSFPPERILIQRMNACPDVDKSIAATEFWIIPPGAKAPEASEEIPSCKIPKSLELLLKADQ